MLIGNDFKPVVQAKTTRCSECGHKIQKGATALESRRFGKCQKRVCSEQCRQDFDDAYWQERARNHEET
jgi:hypothetical protein